MRIRRILVIAGAVAALCLIVVSTALAAGTSVSVRVEGVKRTLLPAAVVTTHSGSITKGGTPAGICPATSGAGALDVASKHKWNGSYGQYGLSVTSIFGENHPLTATSKYYWSIWVANKYAPAGICDLKLHQGEQLLFAAVPDAGTAYPIVLTAPKQATKGRTFKVKAYYYKGNTAKPLTGASVKGASGKTNNQGLLTVTPNSTGKLKLSASDAGGKVGGVAVYYIRSATTTVTVKS